jgi:glycosyltransferase involved in cell wall biosynthesis
MLTICIPTIPERATKLQQLLEVLKPQAAAYGTEILINESESEKNGGKTTGAKRNELIEQVKTPYACFIDDDDMIAPDYMDAVYEGLLKDVDVVGFEGIITTAGHSPYIFRHSIKYNYEEKKVNGRMMYFRPPNHLNPMRTDFFRAVPFPDITFAEDYSFCNTLKDTGLITTEHYIDRPIYFYQYNHKK